MSNDIKGMPISLVGANTEAFVENQEAWTEVDTPQDDIGEEIETPFLSYQATPSESDEFMLESVFGDETDISIDDIFGTRTLN
ncbi:MAG: hypothetical protein ACJARD_000106 [Alphaproteobacteria bacterium]|jgi:hypothetical protein